MDRLPPDAAPGVPVDQQIDWAWRFDKMQQHTGEHILSGTLHRLFGAENVGFHIGSEAVRMDTSVPISPEGLRQAETEANRFVWQDLPVRVLYPSPEQLAHMTYRSKKEIAGQVRIVAIPGADTCACCGTHTATTGQVGLIKIVSAERYKGGMRLAVLCGGRALAEMQAMQARQGEIVAELSAKPAETAHAVRRVHAELGPPDRGHRRPVRRPDPHRKRLRLLPGPPGGGRAAPHPRPERRLQRPGRRQARHLPGQLRRTEKGCGYCLARRAGDVRPLTRALNAACSGRGGGKPGICQGSCAASPEAVARFLRSQAGAGPTHTDKE